MDFSIFDIIGECNSYCSASCGDATALVCGGMARPTKMIATLNVLEWR